MTLKQRLTLNGTSGGAPRTTLRTRHAEQQQQKLGLTNSASSGTAALPAVIAPPTRNRNLRDGLVLGLVLLAAGYVGYDRIATTGEVDRLGTQVSVLSSQVESLGGTPVVVPPSDSPTVVTVPGPEGRRGLPGLNGADSTVPGPEGRPGSNGADSTVPGPEGRPGTDGENGQPGSSPSCLSEPAQCRGPEGPMGPEGPPGPTCEPGWHPETVAVGLPLRDARICVQDPPAQEGP